MISKSFKRYFFAVLVMFMGTFTFLGTASANNGDNLRLIHGGYSQPCWINTGIAFDGTNLIIPCYAHNTLDFLSPVDGHLVKTVQVPGVSSLGAAAWDSGRQKLWACEANTDNVVLIDTVTGQSTTYFSTPGCLDGLAYDGKDDTLWISPDISDTVYHYNLDGTIIGTAYVAGMLAGCGNSGIAVGGDSLFLANNGCSQIYQVSKDFSTSSLFASFPARLEDMECDDITFAGDNKSAIWSIDAYDREINAWEIPAGLCGYGGKPPQTDPQITVSDQSSTEGTAASFSIGSFTDNNADNPWAVDVDWGDGSAHAAFTVNATGSLGTQLHTYVDNGSYSVTVKVTDNGGSVGTSTFTIAVANTAPAVGPVTVSANPAAANTSVGISANFSDPGTVDTHTAVIDWGDGNTSIATVTETNGSGSAAAGHVYASAGTYTVKATVTDKDGGVGESSSSITVKVDSVAPITKSKLSPIWATNKAGLRYISGYTVTVTATDDFSGVKQTWYKVNDGAWTVYTVPFNAYGNPNLKVQYYSEDNAGNKETVH